MKTYKVTMHSDSGSFQAESIAYTFNGEWYGASSHHDHDLVFIKIPDDEVEGFEACLEEDDNVISYSEY